MKVLVVFLVLAVGCVDAIAGAGMFVDGLYILAAAAWYMSAACLMVGGILLCKGLGVWGE